MPPIYSAIKVNGKKLYEYARKGQNVEIKPREIEIYDIKLINIDAQKKQIQFEVFCGKSCRRIKPEWLTATAPCTDASG